MNDLSRHLSSLGGRGIKRWCSVSKLEVLIDMVSELEVLIDTVSEFEVLIDTDSSSKGSQMVCWNERSTWHRGAM